MNSPIFCNPRKQFGFENRAQGQNIYTVPRTFPCVQKPGKERVEMGYFTPSRRSRSRQRKFQLIVIISTQKESLLQSWLFLRNPIPGNNPYLMRFFVFKNSGIKIPWDSRMFPLWRQKNLIPKTPLVSSIIFTLESFSKNKFNENNKYNYP